MSALKNALDAINREAEAFDDPSQLLVAAKCRSLLRGYDAMWKDAGYVTLEAEKMLTAPIVNPATQRDARTLSQAGKLDVIAERGGRKILIDHKTTSQDITDPNATYWRQLMVDSQVSHYMLLGWLNGIKFDDAVWDVIRKPSISPKKLSKANRQAAVASREYCGVKLSNTDLAALQLDPRETLPMYEARLTIDCTKERPEWYFQRRSVGRIDAELLDYAKELWSHSKAILHERKNELPVRNSGACMLYGSPCEFLGVCSGYDTIDSDKWKTKHTAHNELPELETYGSDVLTNSRIRTFQTCRRKHYYEYELGKERADAEEREALFFGSLVHVGLEAWFLTFSGSSYDSCNGDSASAVGQRASAGLACGS